MPTAFIKAIVAMARLAPLVGPPLLESLRQRIATRAISPGEHVLDHDLLAVRRDVQLLAARMEQIHGSFLAAQWKLRVALWLGALAIVFALTALILAALT